MAGNLYGEYQRLTAWANDMDKGIQQLMELGDIAEAERLIEEQRKSREKAHEVFRAWVEATKPKR